MKTMDAQALKWPTRRDPENRLEPICRPVINPAFTFDRPISVFTIGSCFARNIEEYLHRLGMHLPTMSFEAPASETPAAERTTALLNKYTPHSILSEIRFALDDSYEIRLDDHFLEVASDQYLDLHLPSYTPVSIERARERRRQIQSTFRSIRDCDLVILTLGLVESWYDQEKQCYICQAPPPRVLARHKSRFEFRRLSFDEARSATFAAANLILQLDERKRIIVTTSPVPLQRTFTNQDVILANTYSKSVLRVIADEIAASSERVDYFPSYETVTLTDRSVAWGDDLRHVNDALVGDIVQRVCEAYFPGMVGRDDVRTQYTEAKLLQSQGNKRDAYRAYIPLYNKLSKDVPFLLDFYKACASQKDWRKAAHLAERAIEVGGETSRRYGMLGEALFRSKEDLPRAEQALGKAIELEPLNPRPRLFMGYTLLRKGDVESARSQLTEGLELAKKTYSKPWILRGLRKAVEESRGPDVAP